MYAPLIAQSAAAAAAAQVDSIVPEQDGVEFASPKDNSLVFGNIVGVDLSERLRSWLIDLHLLRHIPLCYLVPDANLLPPESIRFFHVDPTWIDRVVDGALTAANIGTVDAVFGYRLLLALRQALNEDLTNLAKERSQVPWDAAKDSMTGMLLRSEAVRRWPAMIVRAFKAAQHNDADALAVLRAEPISRDIYIALFAGQPRRVELAEPYVGLRYGVEPKNAGSSDAPYQVNRRTVRGSQVGDETIPSATAPLDAQRLLKPGTRVVDVAFLWARVYVNWRHDAAHPLTLSSQVGAGDESPEQDFGTGGRGVALHLEQRPYVQVFQAGTEEEHGSRSIDEAEHDTLRSGRKLNLDRLKSRLKERTK